MRALLTERLVLLWLQAGLRRLLCSLCFLWHETRLSHLGTARLSRLGSKLVYPAWAGMRDADAARQLSLGRVLAFCID